MVAGTMFSMALVEDIYNLHVNANLFGSIYCMPSQHTCNSMHSYQVFTMYHIKQAGLSLLDAHARNSLKEDIFVGGLVCARILFPWAKCLAGSELFFYHANSRPELIRYLL